MNDSTRLRSFGAKNTTRWWGCYSPIWIFRVEKVNTENEPLFSEGIWMRTNWILMNLYWDPLIELRHCIENVMSFIPLGSHSAHKLKTVLLEQIEDKLTDFWPFSQLWSVRTTNSYQNNINIDVNNKFWIRYIVPLTYYFIIFYR